MTFAAQYERIVRLQHRILDPGRRWDYLIVTIYAASPLLLAWMIGAAASRQAKGINFKGYLDASNWLYLIGILPFSLWVVRTVTDHLAPVSVDQTKEPPLCEILGEAKDKDKEGFCKLLHTQLFRHPNFTGALLISLLIHIFDMKEVLGFYSREVFALAQPVPREPDWTLFFVGFSDVSAWSNFMLVLLAYSVQFMVATIAFYFFAILLQHNIFFLRSVYQRRYTPENQRQHRIEIDLDDADECFGFRKANKAFNIQVRCLLFGGIAALTSRFQNVPQKQSDDIYQAVESVFGLIKLDDSALDKLFKAIDPSLLFPDIGQWILFLAWILLLVIVSIPAIVKMLPRLGPRRIRPEIVPYLQEFIAPGNWLLSDDPTSEELGPITRKFARNSFWPTGNNRATRLFFFSFFTVLVMIVPLRYDSQKILIFCAFYVTMAAVAGLLTACGLKALEWYLGGIDSRLVDPKAS